MEGKGDPSGMVVYPKLPVPANRPESKLPGHEGGYSKPKIGAAVALVALIGGAIGFLLAPDKKVELEAAKKEAATQQTAANFATVLGNRGAKTKNQINEATNLGLYVEEQHDLTPGFTVVLGGRGQRAVRVDRSVHASEHVQLPRRVEPDVVQVALRELAR